MSKKANPTAIGLFVVIGLVLGVGGLVLFGSSKLFSKTAKYILYFDTSVTGLNVGAPVKFRGVTVGSVDEVLIRHNQNVDDNHMPVIIQLNGDLLTAKTDKEVNLGDEAAFQRQIDKGLRATMKAQSLVTGLLYVELDFVRGATPPTYHQQVKLMKEIPTEPTRIQQLMENVARMDFQGIADKLNSILSKLDSRLDQLKVQEINDGLTNLLFSLNRVAASPQLTNSLVSLTAAADEIRLLSEKIRSKVDPVTASADETLELANQALAEFTRGVQDVRDFLSPRSPLRRDLPRTVDSINSAARAIAELMDYLSRNPNALITGRKSAP